MTLPRFFFSSTHKKVTWPFQAVPSQNWVVIEVTVSWSLIGQFLPILDSHWLILEPSTTNLRYHIQAYAFCNNRWISVGSSHAHVRPQETSSKHSGPPEGAGNSSLHPRTSKTSWKLNSKEKVEAIRGRDGNGIFETLIGVGSIKTHPKAHIV